MIVGITNAFATPDASAISYMPLTRMSTTIFALTIEHDHYANEVFFGGAYIEVQAFPLFWDSSSTD
jgi:hypothetical protein